MKQNKPTITTLKHKINHSKIKKPSMIMLKASWRPKRGSIKVSTGNRRTRLQTASQSSPLGRFSLINITPAINDRCEPYFPLT